MDIRMMGFDMDGTLYSSAGEFPEINCRALQECERRGIKLVFCSGRPFETLREFAKRVGVNPILASYNGARIDETIDGPTLLERPLDDETAKTVYEAMMDSKTYFLSFTRGASYMTQTQYRIGRHNKHVKQTTVENKDGYTYRQIVDDELTRTEGIKSPYKFVACGVQSDPRFEIIRNGIRHLNMSISSSSGDNFEVMMPGVDKGFAMKWLAERYGFAPEQVMVFGDHLNDVEMFEYAGWPVAMENGIDKVKKLAKIIAPHHDEGGVGQVIYKYVLNAQ